MAWWRTGKARLVWLLGALVAVAYGASLLFPAEAYWIFVAATLVAVFPFGRRAVAMALAGTPFSIETLMVAAALGAVVIGAAEEAAVVVLLFAVGEMLENVAAGQARSGIKALADLIPRTARVEQNGAIIELPAERLSIGDIVQARPGDRIPCDGLIVEGNSALDESPVTGESVPVARGVGEAVMAGSVNTSALLRLRVTATSADNTLSRIVKMVEEATASRAPTQRFIEKFSTYWTPGAMVVSLLVILVAATAVRAAIGGTMDLPGPGRAANCLPLRPGDLGPGCHGVGACGRRAPRACWSKAVRRSRRLARRRRSRSTRPVR